MSNKIEFLSMLRANNISSGYETEGHAPRLLKKIKIQGGYIDILVLKKEFVAFICNQMNIPYIHCRIYGVPTVKFSFIIIYYKNDINSISIDIISIKM